MTMGIQEYNRDQSHCANLQQICLKHWRISQKNFSNTFSWMKIYEFWLRFHRGCVPMGPINTIPALFQIMAWRRPGDKPLYEQILLSLPTHICVTRPQWEKSVLSHKDHGCLGFRVSISLPKQQTVNKASTIFLSQWFLQICSTHVGVLDSQSIGCFQICNILIAALFWIASLSSS